MPTKTQVRKFLTSILESFGVLWLLVEATSYFFADYAWTKEIPNWWWAFLVIGIVLGLYRARPIKKFSANISDSDVKVIVRIGDVFKGNEAVVVGSNATFDTAIEDRTISPDSVQGQFTTKYCPTVSDLDRQLDDGLATETPARTIEREAKSYGKLAEYELGTVIPIQTSDRKAYFAAIARMNAHRAASVSSQDFLDALPIIWSAIRERGGMEPLNCPILGSGYARLTLTRQQLAEEIIRSFVAASHEGKLSETLTVVIAPDDEDQFDIVRLQQFLEYQCVYGRSPLSDTATRGVEAG